MPTIKEQIDIDLKTALLGGDKPRAEVLRGLKSVVLYAEVAAGSRDSGGLDDEAVTALLARESKKRQESADLYVRGGAADKAAKELSEKAIIDTYLPVQLGEAEVAELVAATIARLQAAHPDVPLGSQQMGQVIGAVKSEAGASADGALVARLVRQQLAEQSSNMPPATPAGGDHDGGQETRQ